MKKILLLVLCIISSYSKANANQNSRVLINKKLDEKVKIEVYDNGDITYSHLDTFVTHQVSLIDIGIEDFFFDDKNHFLFVYGENISALPDYVFTLKIFRVNGSMIELVHTEFSSIVFSSQICKFDSLYVFGNVQGGLFSMNSSFEFKEIFLDSIISDKYFKHIYVKHGKIIALTGASGGEIYSIENDLQSYKHIKNFTEGDHYLVYAINSGDYLLTKATDSIFIYDSQFNPIYKEVSFERHCIEVENNYFVIVFRNKKYTKLDFRSGEMVQSSHEITLPQNNKQNLRSVTYENHTLSSLSICKDTCKINKEIEDISAYSFVKDIMILGVKKDLLIYKNQMKLIKKSPLQQDEYVTYITTNINSPFYTVFTTNRNLYTYNLAKHSVIIQQQLTYSFKPGLAINKEIYAILRHANFIGFECIDIKCKTPRGILSKNKIIKYNYMHSTNCMAYSQADSTLVIHDMVGNDTKFSIKFTDDIKDFLVYEKNLLALTASGNLYMVSSVSGKYSLLMNGVEVFSSILKDRILVVKNNELIRYNLVKKKNEKVYLLEPIKNEIAHINFISLKGKQIAHILTKDTNMIQDKEETKDSYITDSKIEGNMLFLFDVFGNTITIEI